MYEIEGLTASEYDVFANGMAARRINVLGDTVLFVAEKRDGNMRGISLRVHLDENGVGSLPSALAGSTLEIYGGSPKPTVIKEWDGQPLDLKL